MRCSGQVATLIILLTVLSLSTRPAVAFNPFKYFFGDTTSRSAKTSPSVIITKAISPVTPHPEDWDTDEASPILITSPAASDKTQYRIRWQRRKNLNGSINGRPEHIRRERPKFRNSGGRSQRRNRVFKERAAARAKFKAEAEKNIYDEKYRYRSNTANVFLVLGNGDGSEEKPTLRRKNVFGRDEPLIIIDVEELAKKANNQKPTRPIHYSDIQLTSDDIIGDQSYYLSDKFDEPNYQQEHSRQNMKGRTEQFGEYYIKLRSNRPNEGSNRVVRGDHFNVDHSKYDTHDDRIDSFQRSSEPNRDYPIYEQPGIYEDSPIQANQETKIKRKNFDGQGSWIVELDSGKYRINKDSITKLDYVQIDKRKIFQADSLEQEEFHYSDVDYIGNYKNQNKRSTSSGQENEHNDFSSEDDKGVQDVILEYDTKGFKDINGVTLVIARGQKDDKKRPITNVRKDSKRLTVTNSDERYKNQDSYEKNSDFRSRNTSKDLVEHSAENYPEKMPRSNSRIDELEESSDQRPNPSITTAMQGNRSDRRSRNSSKSRSYQDSLRNAVSQAQSASRIVNPSHRSNWHRKQRLPNSRYLTQDIERMSPVANSAADDFEIPTLAAGEQNFHSLEEWTGSVSPNDKSLFESSQKGETEPLKPFRPHRSDFSYKQNISRWSALNRSQRYSPSFSLGRRPSAPYPRALKSIPPDYGRISKS